jgi:hypothetical protein
MAIWESLGLEPDVLPKCDSPAHGLTLLKPTGLRLPEPEEKMLNSEYLLCLHFLLLCPTYKLGSQMPDSVLHHNDCE